MGLIECLKYIGEKAREKFIELHFSIFIDKSLLKHYIYKNYFSRSFSGQNWTTTAIRTTQSSYGKSLSTFDVRS